MSKILGVDYRSLTLFRQIIALLYIFLFFVIRVLFFEYYSIDKGPFSNDAMQSVSNPPFLLFLLPNDVAFISFLVIGLIVGVLLFLGIFSSITAFLACGFYILSARRFIPYYYGTDEIVVVFLFLLGLVYYLNPKQHSENNYLNLQHNPFLILLFIQIAIIYFFNGINKTGMEWWNGEAVKMALFNVQFNKPLGIQFLHFDFLNKGLTYFTLLFEITLPLLIFYPAKSYCLRIMAGVLILAFHWGIDLFASVTLYKFTAIAFFILLMPANFWQKFSFLKYFLIDFNIRLKLPYISFFSNKVLGITLAVFLIFKACNASLERQNERYQFIKNETFKSINSVFTSRTYSPFRQYWFMFAPSPPVNSGYIAFEYVDGKNAPNNINIYGNNMPSKSFAYYHPFHVCSIIQFNRLDKGLFPAESQFILLQLFKFEVDKDEKLHSQRLYDQYELVLYKQSYEDFLHLNKYIFQRVVLANYE